MIVEPTTAMRCCYYMHQYGFTPRTLFNIGVGRCPELAVWKWLLPETELVGIDARGRSDQWGNERYISCALNDGSSQTMKYCRNCRHCFCELPQHSRKRINVPADTLDRIAIEFEPPFFIWLDIDGCEIAALKGATKTLEQTPWLNCEVRNFEWAPHYASDLITFLAYSGFKKRADHLGTDDKLFRRILA